MHDLFDPIFLPLLTAIVKLATALVLLVAKRRKNR